MHSTDSEGNTKNNTTILIRKRRGIMIIYGNVFAVIGLFDINHTETDKLFCRIQKKKQTEKSYPDLIIPNEKFVYLVHGRTQKFCRSSATESELLFPPSKLKIYLYVITSIL